MVIAALPTKDASPATSWRSQLLFIPFVLVDPVVPGARHGVPLDLERVVNIALEALGAVVWTLVVFRASADSSRRRPIGTA